MSHATMTTVAFILLELSALLVFDFACVSAP